MLSVRLAGVELLAAAKRDSELVALTDDKDPLVAVQAAIAIKKAHPELGAKALSRAIAAEDWTDRAGAANVMVQAVGKGGALPFAQKLILDAEIGVRLAAARVLVQAGDKDGARRVFLAAIDHPDQGVQAAADLAALGDPAGVRALSMFVHDAKRTPQQRAVAASAHHTAHHVTPGLVAALADADGLVRVEAAAVLGVLAK
jgi:HEAT repeat protein